MGGGFGCDFGDLPPPPGALAWFFIAFAIAGLVIGGYMLVTGLPLVRFGTLKQISTKRGGRLLGLALVLDSAVSVLIAQFIILASQHIEPPRWFELIFLAAIPITALQWVAFRIDRRPKAASQ